MLFSVHVDKYDGELICSYLFTDYSFQYYFMWAESQCAVKKDPVRRHVLCSQASLF